MENKLAYNNVLIAFTLSLLLMFSSCADFLNREPLGALTQDDFDGGNSFEGQVMGLYADLRSEGTSGIQLIAIHSIRSDDAEKGSTVSDAIDTESMFDNFDYVSTHWILSAYWTHHYTLIHHANTIISDIERLGKTETNTLINKAEAKFMRAYAYFNLVRTFGEIPKINFKVSKVEEANISKSQVDEIYALIDKDLEEAARVLPPVWDSKFIGRLTSGAAKSLQARTFVTRQMWDAAYSSATLVINSGIYDLRTPYDRIFTELGENCRESILEIQAKFTKTEKFGINYALGQGIRGSGKWDMGWGWNTPSDDFANKAFEKESDPRRSVTLLFSGQKNTPYGEDVPAPTSELPRKYWNKKVYTDPSQRVEFNSRFGEWVNVRLIRYADVVLLAAEAANEIGTEEKIKEALTYVNDIRYRASGGDARLLPQRVTTDQQELRRFIRQERRAELGMELERFYDLVRWGVQDEKNGLTGNDVYDIKTLHAVGKTNYQRKHRYLPIPQAEVDKSNGVLTQNSDF